MSTRNQKAVDLPQLIIDHPEAHFIVDNDWWEMFVQNPDENPYEDDTDAYDIWAENNRLATSSDNFEPKLGDGGYGSGNCYGGDILQALAMIVGVTIESV